MMHNDHNTYIQAVKNAKKIILTYFSGKKSLYLTKLCVPVHYSLSVSQGGPDHYYFWDDEADVGEKLLGLPSIQIKFMELSDEAYNPKEYIGSEAN